MNTKAKTSARFDARLTKEQKKFFEKAAFLGGYRSLTDFVVLTVQEKAKEIIEESEQIIASARDSEVFFNAVTKNSKPNKALVNALEDYNTFAEKTKLP